MFGTITAAIDRRRGTGSASVAIPLFDGALKPNSRLDEAGVLAHVDGVSDIAVSGPDRLYCAADAKLLELDRAGKARVVVRAPGSILAIACNEQWLALAVEGELLLFDREHALQSRLRELAGAPLGCITALAFASNGKTLMITRGASSGEAANWKRDLLTHGSSGQLLRLDLASMRGELLATGLRWPNGVVQRPDGGWLVSEAWDHRLVLVTEHDRVQPAYTGLPGYPARLHPAAEGGYWISLFARRTQLIEFVLREPGYRRKMIETIPEPYWIAPSLRSGDDFLEPLQFGAVRQMGILKPWAPSNSYGIVVRLDEELVPQYSCHSRAGGKHHGTVSAVEWGGSLYVASRGSNSVLKVELVQPQT